MVCLIKMTGKWKESLVPLRRTFRTKETMASFLDVMVVDGSDVGSLIHVLIIILVFSLVVDKSVGALFIACAICTKIKIIIIII